MENPITQICTRHKIFRKELSRQTKIPYSTVNALVVGELMKYPSYQTAEKLCHYLELSPGEFLDLYAQWKNSLIKN